jgi:hypothetical protein
MSKIRYWFELKRVKTKKEHVCACCSEKIDKGVIALVNSGFRKGEGYYADYFHSDAINECYKEFIDVCQPDKKDTVDRILDINFMGQIEYSSWKELRE